MKLLVEFELDESWDAYIPNDNEKIKSLVKPQLEGVKIRIVKNLDLQNVRFSEVRAVVCEYNDVVGCPHAGCEYCMTSECVYYKEQT